MSLRPLYRLALWIGFLAHPLAAENLTELSSALTPHVAFDAERTPSGLKIVVEADTFDDNGDISLELGLAGKQLARLGDGQAKRSRKDKTCRWEFLLPAEKDTTSPRLAFALAWKGGPQGVDRLRQRFRHVGPAAAHVPLSTDPADWQPLDLEERTREAADRALEIAIDFDQAIEGKASVVIERPDGTRVRNLLSGQTMPKGRHRLVWDGLDEAGNIAAPGDYRWRAISHPGLRPVHLMDFCDGPGSNHGTFQAAATNGKSLFFAAPVAEGGHEIVELAPDGTFIRGFNPPHGHGLSVVSLAADENFLYAAHDGLAWGKHVDRSKPDWKEERTISVMRIDLKSGNVAEFPGGLRHSPLLTYEAGPGSEQILTEYRLSGIALWQGSLWLADQYAQEIIPIDPATGQRSSATPIQYPRVRALASHGDKLYTISEGDLTVIEGNQRKIRKIARTSGGLYVQGPDEIYVSDKLSRCVRVFDDKGREGRTIGKPGGIVSFRYDPLSMYQPAGLAVLDGKLWVTEQDRWRPKRLAAFDTLSGAVVKEYFGPTNYGAQGAGFDPLDPTRWIGQDTLWKLDFAKRSATPQIIFEGKSGRRHSFWRQDGRTFIITCGKVTWIQELTADNQLHPRACLSSAHQFSYAYDWQPPDEFIEAFQRDFPEANYKGSKGGMLDEGKPGHGYGMLWVDRNGDEALDPDEIEFTAKGTSVGGAGWSHDFNDLTLRVPGERNGKPVLVTLAPDSWWRDGAPRYPSLKEAVAKAPEIDLPGSSMVESITDRFGNTVMNSDPAMRSISPEGKLRWTYPNRWSNVHGSHNAPLPKTGELQGSLFYSGMAPLDDTSDVMLINGNHGRAFVMTSDGIYLDEMFPDVRMMTNPQAGGIGILGGECFGGTFGRSKDGDYYFQGGGISYRIYRVEGLGGTRRAEGRLVVSGEQSLAAARNQNRVASVSSKIHEATLPWGDQAREVAKWDKDGNFPVTVKASRDGNLLRLQYEVADASPWVNQGKDWQSLFKTGDGVDLQLGISPAADPRRTDAAEGDLRLFIAPMGEENVAVLYRHRFPGAAANEAVNFQSPWRSEKVDQVKRLENAAIKVERSGNGYKVAIELPLSELGLGAPEALQLRGDFGVIYGDPAGTINTFRNYWSNQATGLVNDVPGEIMLSPNLWGQLNFSPAPNP
ncbi:hypothetical protein [Luteolibacter luteus]|uniref:FlgD Ig-like domain-containing protein n=1 Tax=Luteolibacter luteus TaxID=2728835 RepID=A0A858RDS4_9BACT|nr:hypothetical protein [Luteolibacter luteus]QJE94947.1 hypothetical protein HHL09_03855 [Luteolibacter luteus]